MKETEIFKKSSLLRALAVIPALFPAAAEIRRDEKAIFYFEKVLLTL